MFFVPFKLVLCQPTAQLQYVFGYRLPQLKGCDNWLTWLPGAQKYKYSRSLFWYTSHFSSVNFFTTTTASPLEWLVILAIKQFDTRRLDKKRNLYRHVLSQMVLHGSRHDHDNFSIVYAYSKPSGWSKLAFSIAFVKRFPSDVFQSLFANRRTRSFHRLSWSRAR